MNGEIAAMLARARMHELHAEADRHRRCRRSRPAGSAVHRWYARLWWAARPRAAVWAPALLGN
ncbi:hypothetical protein [Pseudonocardia sp. HH130630-07]|uniref:hypothetical protein n=1 Tax=Pseudonocardia sp. HH130630-07 TaxID=1690815 RepID=UPI000814DF67|nr:hypothetical protein [Pseudonocardia sp. HH130630-07]ANY07649.1 hypothetical protein AFB00_16610 [Pseudonocardia sp. HH130630-07]